MKISKQLQPNRRFNNLQEAQDAFNDISKQLNQAFREIERGVANASSITVNVGGISGTSPGGSSTSLDGVLKGRSRSVALTAGVTKTVTFSSAISAIFSLSSIRVTDASGYMLLDYTISNITASGFDINAPVDATLIYLAVEET